VSNYYIGNLTMQGMKELLEISPFTHTHWGNNNHWQNPTFTYVYEW